MKLSAKKPKSMKNREGILCRSFDGSFFFRIYGRNRSFRDYYINHFDMSIRILDDDAYAYRHGDEWIIDHSPKTLKGTSKSKVIAASRRLAKLGGSEPAIKDIPRRRFK